MIVPLRPDQHPDDVDRKVNYIDDRQGILLKGIIFNRFQPGNRMHEDNVKLCEHLTGVRAAALVRDGDTHLNIPAERLRSLYE